MSKKTKRWPIWKIVVLTLGCGLACPVLFWLSGLLGKTEAERAGEPFQQTPVLTLSSLIVILGVASAILCALGIFWTVVRVRDARTPAWKKRAKKQRF